MNPKEPGTCRRVCLAMWVFPAMLLLAGCTPEKAGALRSAAYLFRSNSAGAVQAIQDLMDSEVAAPPRSDAARADEFVKNILSLPKDTALSGEVIGLASDPYAVQLSAQERGARDATLERVQKQYEAFASMFDDLDRGSFLAKDKVAKTKTYAVALTAQMASLATSFSQQPPRFIQKRASIISKMEAVRKDARLSAEQQRQELAELKGSWDQLVAEEVLLQRSVVEKCFLAAASGQTVLQMIDAYNKLSVDELGKMSESILAAGEQISGRNLASIRTQNEKVVGYLNANPEYKLLLKPALESISSRTAPDSRN